MLLAGILFLGSGVGLCVLRVFCDRGWRNSGLTSKEWPWFLGTVVFGGVAGPILIDVGFGVYHSSLSFFVTESCRRIYCRACMGRVQRKYRSENSGWYAVHCVGWVTTVMNQTGR